MKRSLRDFLQDVPPQHGNGGRTLKTEGASNDAPQNRPSQLDKTTAAAKLIIEEEARERAEKAERLRAARAARDASERNDD